MRVAELSLKIEARSKKPNARILADAFEVLDERKQEMEIPFETILAVGRAYGEIGEFERAHDVFHATIEAGFGRDSYLSAAIEDQGRFLDAVDYMKNLWQEYPDDGEMAEAFSP